MTPLRCVPEGRAAAEGAQGAGAPPSPRAAASGFAGTLGQALRRHGPAAPAPSGAEAPAADDGRSRVASGSRSRAIAPQTGTSAASASSTPSTTAARQPTPTETPGQAETSNSGHRSEEARHRVAPEVEGTDDSSGRRDRPSDPAAPLGEAPRMPHGSAAAVPGVAHSGSLGPAPARGAREQPAPDGRAAPLRVVGPAAGRLASQATFARAALPLPDGSRHAPAGKPGHGERGHVAATEEKPARAREPLDPVRAPGAVQQPLIARADVPFAAPAELRAQAPAHAGPGEASRPAAAPRTRGPEVDGAVLRSAAHLRIETPGLGEMELHLRIRDSVAHLRVEGEGAGLLEARAAELSRALAGEGLRLGPIEVSPHRAPDAGAGDPGSREQRGAWRPPEERQQPSPPPPPRSAPVRRSGVHVKA